MLFSTARTSFGVMIRFVTARPCSRRLGGISAHQVVHDEFEIMVFLFVLAEKHRRKRVGPAVQPRAKAKLKELRTHLLGVGPCAARQLEQHGRRHAEDAANLANLLKPVFKELRTSVEGHRRCSYFIRRQQCADRRSPHRATPGTISRFSQRPRTLAFIARGRFVLVREDASGRAPRTKNCAQWRSSSAQGRHLTAEAAGRSTEKGIEYEGFGVWIIAGAWPLTDTIERAHPSRRL